MCFNPPDGKPERDSGLVFNAKIGIPESRSGWTCSGAAYLSLDPQASYSPCPWIHRCHPAV